MSDETGVILLGRGGYGSAPAEQMGRLVESVSESITARFVTAAFIDGGSPALPDALERCAAQGVERVLVVPVYLPTDRNLDNWLSRVIRRWLHHQPESGFTVHMTTPLGDAPELAEAAASLVSRYVTSPGEPLSANHANPNSPEWSVIPPHTYHVLVCRGPRCNTAGAGETAQALKQQLRAKNMGDDEVLVAQTGCLFPCNLGPVIVVYPDGVWYGGLTETAVVRIGEAHFEGGQVIEHYARYPADGAQQRPTNNEQEG
jgi:(2Fe-2S) ferredoxin